MELIKDKELRDDKEVALEAVKKRGLELGYLSARLQNDYDVVFEAVSNNGRALQSASCDLQNNFKIIKAALEQDGYALQYVGKKPLTIFNYFGNYTDISRKKDMNLNDPDYLELGAFKGSDGQQTSIRQNKEIIKEILQKNGLSLKYIDLDFCQTFEEKRELVRDAAILNNAAALEFAPDELKNDRSTVKRAIQKNGLMLKFASDALRNDKTIALEAIKNDAFSYKYISQTLKEDKSIANTAFNNNPMVLQHIDLSKIYDASNREEKSSQLKKALKKKPQAIQFLDRDSILSIKEVIEDILAQYEQGIDYIPFELQDEDMWKIVVAKDGSKLMSANDLFRRDLEIIRIAMRNYPKAVSLIEFEEIKNDKELLTKFLCKNAKQYPKIAKEFQDDEEIAEAILEAKAPGLGILESYHPEKCKEHIKKNGKLFQYFTKLRRDYDCCLAAVSQSAHMLTYVQFSYDQISEHADEIIRAAIKANPYEAMEQFYNIDEDLGTGVFDYIKYACSLDGLAFEYGEDYLEGDEYLEAAKIAIKNNPEIIDYIYNYEGLENDIKEVIKEKPNSIEHISKRQCKTMDYVDLVQIALEADIKTVKLIEQEVMPKVKLSLFEKALEEDENLLKYIEETKHPNKQECYAKICALNGLKLQHVPKHLQTRDAVHKAVENNPKALQFAQYNYQNDHELVIRACDKDYEALKYASPDIRKDRSHVMEILKKQPKAFRYVDPTLWNDQDLIKEAIKDADFEQFSTDILRDQFEIVDLAVRQNPNSVVHAGTNMRNNEEIAKLVLKKWGSIENLGIEIKNTHSFAKEAVTLNWKQIAYISRELQDDDDIIRTAIKANGQAIEYISNYDARSDYVTEALESYGMALKYGNDFQKNDKDLVLQAVKHSGNALEFASKALKDDPVVVEAAVNNRGAAIRFVSERLRSDPKICAAAVENQGSSLNYMPREIKKKRDIVARAVNHYGYAFNYAHRSLWDKDLFMIAVKSDRSSNYILDDVKRDFDVHLYHIKYHINSYNLSQFTTPGYFRMAFIRNLRDDPSFLAKASRNIIANVQLMLMSVRIRYEVLQYCSPTLKCKKCIVEAAIQNNGLAIQYAHKSFRRDRETVLVAIQNNHYSTQYIDDDLKEDSKFMLHCASLINPEVLYYASQKLHDDADFIESACKLNPENLNYLHPEDQIAKQILYGFSPEFKEHQYMQSLNEIESKGESKVNLESPSKQPGGSSVAKQSKTSKAQNPFEKMQAKHKINSMRDIINLVIYCCKYNSEALLFVPNSFSFETYEKSIMDIVSRNGFCLKYIPLQYHNNIAIISKAVSVNGLSIYYAETTRNKFEIYRKAIQANGCSIALVEHDEFDKDQLRELMQTAIIKRHELFRFFQEYSRDEEFVQPIIEQNGLALQYVQLDLMKYPQLVTTAVLRNPEVFTKLSQSIQNDVPTALKALEKEISVYNQFNDSIKYNTEIVKKVVTKDISILKDDSIPDRLRNDPVILEKAIECDPMAFLYATDELKKRKDVIKKAVAKKPLLLAVARLSEFNLKDQKDIVKEILTKESNDGSENLCFAYAPQSLAENQDFMKELLKSNKAENVLIYADSSIQKHYLDSPDVKSSVKENIRLIIELEKNPELRYADIPNHIRDVRNLIYKVVLKYPEEFSKIDEWFRYYDEDIVKVAVAGLKENLKNTSQYMRNNIDIALEAVQNDDLALDFVADKFKKDKRVVEEAINQNIYAKDAADPKTRQDLTIVQTILKKCRATTDTFKEEKDIEDEKEKNIIRLRSTFVKEALTLNGLGYQFLADKLKETKLHLRTALQQNGLAIQYIPEAFKDDNELYQLAVEQTVDAVQFVIRDLGGVKNVPQSMLNEALKQDGNILKFLDDLNDNYDTVLMAVQQDGKALEFASERLKNDSKIVRSAVNNTGVSLEFASEDLKSDKSLVKQALRKDFKAIKHAAASFTRDIDILQIAVEVALKDKTQEREQFKELVKLAPFALEFIPDSYKDDDEIVEIAIASDPFSFRYASQQLKDNRDFVERAVKISGMIINFLNSELKKDDTIVKIAIQKSPMALEYVSFSYQDDELIVLDAVKSQGAALQFASDRLRNRKDIVKAAMKNDEIALQYANESMKKIIEEERAKKAKEAKEKEDKEEAEKQKREKEAEEKKKKKEEDKKEKEEKKGEENKNSDDDKKEDDKKENDKKEDDKKSEDKKEDDKKDEKKEDEKNKEDDKKSKEEQKDKEEKK